MAWDGLTTVGPQTGVGTTEVYIGRTTGLTSPIDHTPGEITDLNVIIVGSAHPMTIPLVIGVYNTLLDSPSSKDDYGFLPVLRFQYLPTSDTTTATGTPERFAVPIGRFFKLVLGFQILSAGAETYDITIEFRQDGVDLAP